MKDVLTQLSRQVQAVYESSMPIYIQGGDTKSFYGEPYQDAAAGAKGMPERHQANSESGQAVQADGQMLDMSLYQGIISYQPSELVMTARAGTRLSDIEQTLAEQNQMLAFEPPRFGRTSTIGGCVASGLSGPRRMAAGSLSDFVLGARLLHSSGKVLAFGGEVMKNVAGYDVSRLLAGSLGSLGPILELSIKVMPVPVLEQTQMLDVDEAGALALTDTWRGLPLPISATAWIPGPETEQGSLYVRVSGSEPAVRSAVTQIGGETLAGDAGGALWTSVRDQTHAFFQQRPLWRIAVPPTTAALNLGPTLMEWNGGLRWLSTQRSAEELRRTVEAHGGHATLYRYGYKPVEVPVFHPLSATLQQINRRMMKQFDPLGLFNPGRRFPIMEG